MSVAVWVALALGIFNVAIWSAVVIAGRRLWRQLGPTVAPLLAMFAPAETSGNASSSVVVLLGDSVSGDDA